MTRLNLFLSNFYSVCDLVLPRSVSISNFCRVCDPMFPRSVSISNFYSVCDLVLPRSVSISNFYRVCDPMLPRSVSISNFYRVCDPMLPRSVSISNFYRMCDPMLPRSVSSIFSFPSGHTVAVCFLLHFPVTSINPSIFPSVIWLSRQFLPKVWPIQLSFLHFPVCRMFLSSWFFVILLHFSHDHSNLSSTSFSSNTYWNIQYGSDVLCEVSQFQHRAKPNNSLHHTALATFHVCILLTHGINCSYVKRGRKEGTRIR